jgi:hypothetical protein
MVQHVRAARGAGCVIRRRRLTWPAMPATGASAGEAANPSAAERRFRIVACVLLALFICAISVGDGEFWPFSKFPMFSRAGRSWKRAIVREVSAEDLQRPLLEIWEKELPGQPVALHHYQINQDDLSAVVRSLTVPLTEEHAALLANYFDRLRHDKTMILYASFGRFRSDRSVRVRFTPLAVIGPDGVRGVPPSEEGDAGAPAGQADAGPTDAGPTDAANPLQPDGLVQP